MSLHPSRRLLLGRVPVLESAVCRERHGTTEGNSGRRGWIERGCSACICPVVVRTDLTTATATDCTRLLLHTPVASEPHLPIHAPTPANVHASQPPCPLQADSTLHVGFRHDISPCFRSLPCLPLLCAGLPHCSRGCTDSLSRCVAGPSCTSLHPLTPMSVVPVAASTVASASGAPKPRAVRLLCLCLGNICRSPLAEGILRREIQRRGLEGWVRH